MIPSWVWVIYYLAFVVLAVAATIRTAKNPDSDGLDVGMTLVSFLTIVPLLGIVIVPMLIGMAILHGIGWLFIKVVR